MPSSPYQQLVGEVDGLAGRLTERYSSHLACRAGCGGCCHHHLSVFSVEAANVRTAVQALSPETRDRVHQQARAVLEREAVGVEAACPLLVNDRCAIYAARPLICRTQGLPLLYEAADGQAEVDFCPLNFTSDEAVAELDEDHLVPLDALNLRLAAVNLSYCRETDLADEASRRIPMSEIILAATREAGGQHEASERKTVLS